MFESPYKKKLKKKNNTASPKQKPKADGHCQKLKQFISINAL